MGVPAMRITVAALACAAGLALCLGLLPRSAHGYLIKGRPWPGGVIGYYNAATDQAWAVRHAVEAWNSSGARIRFVAVPAAQAQLRIEHFQGVSCTINSEATVGYARVARIWIFRRDDSSPYCNSYMAVQALAHELGHVLGLGHEVERCARMNPSGSLQGPRLCPRGQPWQWRCQVLTADDIAGAVALYGGTAGTPSGPRDCDLYRGIGAPSGLRVAWAGPPHEVRITFRRPRSIAIPRFLAAVEAFPESFVAAVVPRRCATDPRSLPHYGWTARPGGVQAKLMTFAPGTSCLTVWAVDSLGRPSDRPAELWVKT